MRRRRVKITGIGPVTPAGIGMDAFRSGIYENSSRTHIFDKIGPEYGEFVVASISDFDINNYIDRFPGQSGSARHTQFAIAAAILAMRDAGITTEDFGQSSATLLVTGTSLMDCEGLKRSYDQVAKLGIKGAYTRAVFSANVASIPATISTALKLNPRMLSIQSSCSSGLDAIGYAAREIAEGRAEVALCGGTEAPLFIHPLIELRSAGLMPNTAENPSTLCRPFDLWRTTGVLGEGACMFVLEPESSSRCGYAYIDGYSYASDRGNISCSGLAQAIRNAIIDAGRQYWDVDVINAWGPGHRTIDATEAMVLQDEIKERLMDVAVCSIKGSIGNPLGAAGAIQVAASAIGLIDQCVPPTVNWEYPDPQCRLNLLRSATSLFHETVLVNSHGISGTNSCLALSRLP